MKRSPPKRIRLRGPRPPAELVRQIARNSAKNRPADPDLQLLFQRMADEAPGVLKMTSSKPGSMNLVLSRGPGSKPVRFTVGCAPGNPLQVDVRGTGLVPVLVTALPSAVLAVALR